MRISGVVQSQPPALTLTCINNIVIYIPFCSSYHRIPMCVSADRNYPKFFFQQLFPCLYNIIYHNNYGVIVKILKNILPCYALTIVIFLEFRIASISFDRVTRS